MSLSWTVLRKRLGLATTKKGCNHGEWGARTVHLDGRRVNACLVLATAAEGWAITTIEGVAPDGSLHPVQHAFIDQDAFRCGFCALVATQCRDQPKIAWRSFIPSSTAQPEPGLRLLHGGVSSARK